MGGFTFDKLLVIGVIALIIFGPERLPGLAEGAAKLVKRARMWVDDTKQRVNEEMGEEFTAEDWRHLDPRQYDPRRIVRDAWNEAGTQARPAHPRPADVSTANSSAAAASASTVTFGTTATLAGPAPYDPDAT